MIHHRFIHLFLLIIAVASPFTGAMKKPDTLEQERARAKAWMWANTPRARQLPMSQAEQEQAQGEEEEGVPPSLLPQPQSLLPRQLPPEISQRILGESQEPLRTLVGNYIYDNIEHPDRVPGDAARIKYRLRYENAQGARTFANNTIEELKQYMEKKIPKFNNDGQIKMLVLNGLDTLKTNILEKVLNLESGIVLPNLLKERQYLKELLKQYIAYYKRAYQGRPLPLSFYRDYLQNEVVGSLDKQLLASVKNYVNDSRVHPEKLKEDAQQIRQLIAQGAEPGALIGDESVHSYLSSTLMLTMPEGGDFESQMKLYDTILGLLIKRSVKK
jgi:hypothetical protein